LIAADAQADVVESATATATTIVAFDFAIAPVPEPAAVSLQVAALFSLLWMKRLRQF